MNSRQRTVLAATISPCAALLLQRVWEFILDTEAANRQSDDDEAVA